MVNLKLVRLFTATRITPHQHRLLHAVIVGDAQRGGRIRDSVNIHCAMQLGV